MPDHAWMSFRTAVVRHYVKTSPRPSGRAVCGFGPAGHSGSDWTSTLDDHDKPQCQRCQKIIDISRG